MRAIFLDIDLVINQSLTIEGASAHHLNVVRIKQDDEILIMNGRGSAFVANIKDITKKFIRVEIVSIDHKVRSHQISLAIACPKKDAFEDIIKFCVELGVKDIYPLESCYSQFDYIPSERFEKIIESAMVQSNNYFLPIIHPQMKLNDFLKTERSLIYFSSLPLETKLSLNSDSSLTILIGPEAGFSNEETALILGHNSVNQIHLPTPILRAPTAVATSVGYLLSLLK